MRFVCALLTGCCCSRSVVLWISAQDADAAAAKSVTETASKTETTAGESIARAREASLPVLLSV
jgi:hypothetical protein